MCERITSSCGNQANMQTGVLCSPIVRKQNAVDTASTVGGKLSERPLPPRKAIANWPTAIGGSGTAYLD